MFLYHVSPSFFIVRLEVFPQFMEPLHIQCLWTDDELIEFEELDELISLWTVGYHEEWDIMDTREYS